MATVQDILASLGQPKEAAASATLKPKAQTLGATTSNVGSGYAGPVPAGYDQAYFTQTGQLRKLPSSNTQPKPQTTSRTTTSNKTVPASTPNYVPATTPTVDLDALFRPIDELYNGLSSTANKNATTDYGTIGSEYTNEKGKIESEEKTLGQENDLNESNFRNSVKSALQEAVRYYNALQQKKNVMYGANSMVGQAMTDIGNQEFLRQQGNINTQSLQGEQQLGLQRSKTSDYIKGKLGDLNTWRKKADAEVDKQLKQTLANISNSRVADKRQAQMDALYDARSKKAALDNADLTYKSGLVQMFVNQGTYSPEEIAGIAQEIFNDPTKSINNPREVSQANKNIEYLQTYTPKASPDQDIVTATSPFVG